MDDGGGLHGYQVGCLAALIVAVAVISVVKGEPVVLNVSLCLGLTAFMYGLGCLLDYQDGHVR